LTFSLIFQVLAACAALHKQGLETVLVTLGSRGALLVPAKGDRLSTPLQFVSLITHFCPYPHRLLAGEPLLQAPAKNVKVVDTTGAGDCFRGAFAVAMAEGMTISESIVTRIQFVLIMCSFHNSLFVLLLLLLLLLLL
jgi:sugar/nucleoside kinase (ribokinase family)